MDRPRSSARGVALPDGRILIVGIGRIGQLESQLYDPASNTWAAGLTIAMDSSSAAAGLVVLHDGTALAVSANITCGKSTCAAGVFTSALASVPSRLFRPDNTTPRLVVSPVPLSFGKTDAGIPVRQTLTLRNTGGATLTGTRFYAQILDRAPDSAGLAAGVDYIVATGDVAGIARAFVTSQEFQARALTFRDYVTLLYRGILGRDPEQAGLDSWESALRFDLLSVISSAFIPSAEFQRRIPRLCAR
jgi:hypothetical protein